jgi:hypothetical protein
MKKYYGFRYFAGKSCTTGEPNKFTGRLSTAGDFVVFDSQEKLDAWLDGEKLTAPCGLDGGLREQVTKNELRYCLRGLTAEQFDEELEYAECN